MKTKLLALAVLAAPTIAASTFAAPALASTRIVQCYVELHPKGGEFSGPCRFTASPDGSFSLRHADANRPVFGALTSISVEIVAPGVADVIGVFADGTTYRWGEALRSTRDRSCWVGSDFTICAR